MNYTLEVYVQDRRTIVGEKLKGKYEYKDVTEQWIREEIRDLKHRLYPSPKYRIELKETYVTRKNMMSGVEFQERYDTPNFCSPASESYWSM